MNLVQCTWSRWWGAWGWNVLFHRPYGYYKEGPKKGKHRNDFLGLHKAHDTGCHIPNPPTGEEDATEHAK